MDRILILILLAIILWQAQTQSPSANQAVAPVAPTRTAMPTFTATTPPTDTPTPQPTNVIVELFEQAQIATHTPQPSPTPYPNSLDTATPMPTPTSPVCNSKLPGAKSYGVAPCHTVSIFDTVAYRNMAVRLGEHRTNGDLTNSNIKCLAINPMGDVQAMGNNVDIWQVANDGSFTSASIQIDNIEHCLWSPDGLFLAVQAADTVWVVPHFGIGYEKDKHAVLVGVDETGARLVGWTISGNILVEDTLGHFWVCHPIRGCVMEMLGVQEVAGVNQYHLPHSGGYDWINFEVK